jgi:adenosylcobinamide-phosphate synthase
VQHADEEQVRAAAIESLAENASDGLTGPLTWFVVAGIPGAAAYRFINTADAMWGYRNDRWRHAGWTAARADDLANVVPARLSGLALAVPGVPLRDRRQEAVRTPSPNAGWPMAATALRLGIRCAKPGTYVLHADGRPPATADTAAAIRLVRRRALALAAGAALLSACLHRHRSVR